MKRVETPAPPDRTLGAASTAKADMVFGPDSAGVADHVVGPPQHSGRAPSRRLQLKSNTEGKAHQIILYLSLAFTLLVSSFLFVSTHHLPRKCIFAVLPRGKSIRSTISIALSLLTLAF